MHCQTAGRSWNEISESHILKIGKKRKKKKRETPPTQKKPQTYLRLVISTLEWENQFYFSEYCSAIKEWEKQESKVLFPLSKKTKEGIWILTSENKVIFCISKTESLKEIVRSFEFLNRPGQWQQNNMHVSKEIYQGNGSSAKSNIEAGAGPGKS